MVDKAGFLQDGFTIVSGLYSEATTQDFVFEAHSVFRQAMESAGISYRTEDDGRVTVDSLAALFEADPGMYIACMSAMQNNIKLVEMSVEPQLTEAVKSLGVQQPAFSTKAIFMMNNPRTSKSSAYWKMPAHQDWRSIQGSLNGMIVWVALEDVTDAVGPLEVIRGSHEWGLLSSEKDEWYRAITDPRVTDDAFEPVPIKRGDAILFSSFLVHRSGINDGSNFRYSMQFRYNDLAEPSFIERKYPTTYGSDVPTQDYVDENDLVKGADVIASFGK